MDNFAIGGNGMSQVLQDANTIPLGGNNLAATQTDSRPDKNKKNRPIAELLREQDARIKLKQKAVRHEETKVAQLNTLLRADADGAGNAIHHISENAENLVSILMGSPTDILLHQAISSSEDGESKKQKVVPETPVAQPLMPILKE